MVVSLSLRQHPLSLPRFTKCFLPHKTTPQWLLIAGRGSFHPRIFLNLKGGRTQKTKAKLVTERRGNDYRVSPLASSVGGQPDPILGVRASPGAPNGDPDTRRRSVVLNDQWCPGNPLKTGEVLHPIAFDISSTVLTFRPVPRTMTSYFSSIMTKK